MGFDLKIFTLVMIVICILHQTKAYDARTPSPGREFLENAKGQKKRSNSENRNSYDELIMKDYNLDLTQRIGKDKYDAQQDGVNAPRALSKMTIFNSSKIENHRLHKRETKQGVNNSGIAEENTNEDRYLEILSNDPNRVKQTNIDSLTPISRPGFQTQQLNNKNGRQLRNRRSKHHIKHSKKYRHYKRIRRNRRNRGSKFHHRRSLKVSKMSRKYLKSKSHLKRLKKRRNLMGGGMAGAAPQLNDSRIIVHAFAPPPIPQPNLIRVYDGNTFPQVIQTRIMLPSKNIKI